VHTNSTYAHCPTNIFYTIRELSATFIIQLRMTREWTELRCEEKKTKCIYMYIFFLKFMVNFLRRYPKLILRHLPWDGPITIFKKIISVFTKTFHYVQKKCDIIMNQTGHEVNTRYKIVKHARTAKRWPLILWYSPYSRNSNVKSNNNIIVYIIRLII